MAQTDMYDWDDPSADNDWTQRDPNAPTPGGEPERKNPDAFGGAQPGGDTQVISRSNYGWGGDEFGADRDVEKLRYQNDIAQQRGAVQMDTRAADAALAQSYADRLQQHVAMAGYRQQLSGRGPSAAQWGGQAALEQALTQQAAIAGQGPNQQLAAGAAGASAMGSAVGQYASARGTETAQAAHGFGGVASAARVGDLMSAGMSQEQALHQAQLEASQRARNDAMAQFYTSQENDIRRQQLAAMGAYEAQRDTNYMNAGNAGRRQAARNNEHATQAMVNTADMGGKVMTMGALSMKGGGSDG